MQGLLAKKSKNLLYFLGFDQKAFFFAVLYQKESVQAVFFTAVRSLFFPIPSGFIPFLRILCKSSHENALISFSAVPPAPDRA
jgi:hypothetical protein